MATLHGMLFMEVSAADNKQVKMMMTTLLTQIFPTLDKKVSTPAKG